MTELDQQLKIAFEKSKRKEKIEMHLLHLATNLATFKIELIQLEKILAKEDIDIKKLEKKSLRNVFLQILGNKETQLEKERQDYLTAFLNKQACQKRITAIKFEEKVLKRQLSALFRIDRELNNLLVKKEQQLKRENGAKSEALFSIDKNILSHQSKLKELREARQAGKTTLKVLLDIAEKLEQVKGWGDGEMFGKGRYSSSAKKRFIDRATKDSYKARNRLERFQEELFDISEQYELHFQQEIALFQDFLKIFFDNLITDWIIQAKIVNTLHVVNNVIDRVKMLLLTVDNEIENTKEFIKLEKQDKRNLLLLSE